MFINYAKKSNLKSTKRCNAKSKESLEVLIEKKCFEATLEAAEGLYAPNLLCKLVPQWWCSYSESPCSTRGSTWSTGYSEQCKCEAEERRARLG